jgi:hypothetical protein
MKLQATRESTQRRYHKSIKTKQKEIHLNNLEKIREDMKIRFTDPFLQ